MAVCNLSVQYPKIGGMLTRSVTSNYLKHKLVIWYKVLNNYSSSVPFYSHSMVAGGLEEMS